MRWNGINKIRQYLEAQEAKGLIFSYFVDGRSGQTILRYETYWNTHSQIILPEAKRLAADEELTLAAHTRPWWTVVDYVSVVLLL